jgi:GNAT superfamily N-acetyltransferase
MALPAIRFARTGDADDLAAIHVAAWRETYTGLMPAGEIARRDLTVRRREWTAMLAAGGTRIVIAGQVGFAQMGPQREPDLAARWPEELHALYLLQSSQGTGLGLALLRAVAGTSPFTAFVLDGNARAMAFYRKTGAEVLGREPLGEGWPDHVLLGWRVPPA